MNRLPKISVLLLALVASVALVACGDSDEEVTTATEPAAETPEKPSREGYGKGEDRASLPTIVIRNGEPVGGVEELEYSAGDEVRFRVSSNRADEVHVHGYDVEQEIPAGGSATLSFPAEIEGIFEVELHESEAQIAELRVNP
jgi:hypothetical protein